MFEEILAGLPFPPAVLLAGGVSGVLCLWLGWTLKGLGARRRENALKQDVLAAKASVPQLESSLRNRESQLERLQEQLKEINKDNAQQAQEREKAERELRSAQRQTANLTSELNAVKGVSKEVDSLVLDGFEDETAGDVKDESPLAARLKKTEAAYEKIKAALFKRDNRIEELEQALQGGADASGADEAAELGAQAADLKARVTSQEETIAHLEGQLGELRQDKEMLEELASRRSKSNRALKEASAEIESQVPALQEEIEGHLQTVKDREASIKRLLNDVESLKFDLTAEQGETQRLRDEVDAGARALQTARDAAEEHKVALAARDQHVSELDNALSASREEIINLQRIVTVADQRIDGLQAKADQLDQVTRQRADLEAVVASRNQQLAQSKNEIDQLLKSEIAAKEQIGQAVADAKRLKLEIDDYKATIAQQERWTEKLKDSLQERDGRNEALTKELEVLRARVSSADAELEYQQTTQHLLETDKHNLEEEVKDATAQTEKVRSALAAAELKLAKAELVQRSPAQPAQPEHNDVTPLQTAGAEKARRGRCKPFATVIRQRRVRSHLSSRPRRGPRRPGKAPMSGLVRTKSRYAM